MSILVRDEVAWLPISFDRLETLREESREGLGWMLEDFLTRLEAQLTENEQ